MSNDQNQQPPQKKPLEWCGEVVPCYRCSGGRDSVTNARCTTCLGSSLLRKTTHGFGSDERRVYENVS